MSAGRGWIALALVVFSTWLPGRLLIGAYLFGTVWIMGLYVQGLGVGIPSQLLSSLPYLVTIVVLVIISGNRSLIRVNTPAMIGQPFRAREVEGDGRPPARYDERWRNETLHRTNTC